MQSNSIILITLFVFSSCALASSCANWANSVTQKWRSFFLEENDFPAYETWDDIDLSRIDLSDFYHNPLAEPIPDKFKRPMPVSPNFAAIGDVLKEVKEEVLTYKVETQELLDEMKGLIRESLDESSCSLLWRMYEEAEPGKMKDRMAATFLEKCKTSLGRQTPEQYL